MVVVMVLNCGYGFKLRLQLQLYDCVVIAKNCEKDAVNTVGIAIAIQLQLLL